MTLDCLERMTERRPDVSTADLSIVIVSWNNEREIIDCLQSIRDYAGNLRCEVFVVDNASRDNTCRIIHEQFPDIYLIANSDNRGFPAANNQAFERVTGRYTLILNPLSLGNSDPDDHCFRSGHRRCCDP